MTKLNQLSFSEYDLNEILTASQFNKLVLFIGAGFSKFSETELVKIPTWSELISELKDDLGLPDESDFLKIAQLYFLKYGQHSYVKKIKSSIKDLEPSFFHKQLFELNPHYIITTNWDGLLEKTAQDLGLAYDLVSSDVDLAQSHLDKKIIKMHGDFRQNNFVFKEDDYLQYSQNFPLIENFIKGIFSTSTVVFLGYSYNDYDLKQIVSWVTTISKATPRKYLLQKNHDDAQALYLRNHGISLLTPMNNNISYFDLYSELFNDLKAIQNQDELIKMILISAEAEVKKIDDNLMMSDSNKKKLKNEIQEHLTKRVNNFVDKKIKALTQYKTLLPEQITKKLTNSTIEYSQSGVSLISHRENLTSDYDKHIRKINNIYLDNVFNTNSDFKKTFLSILEKAFINAVRYGYNHKEVKLPSGLELELYGKMYFSYSQDSAEILFVNHEYGKLLEMLTSKVKYYINEKNYILATIQMANFDNVYNILKQEFLSNNDANLEAFTAITKNRYPFDFKSKIIDFPRDLQSDLRDLVEILEFTEIYKAYYRFDVESRKNLGYLQTRKNGGIASSHDEFKLRYKLYPYVYFILGNDILIEEFTEVKTLFWINIIGSMEHSLAENTLYVNVMDLFILIKYCDTKKLKEFLDTLVKGKKITTIKTINNRASYHNKKYLLIALKNISTLMGLKKNNSIYTTSIDRWASNILIVLGCFQWSSNQLKTIIINLTTLLEQRTQNLVIYDNVRLFLSVNEFLYQKSHPDMLKALDIILEKIHKKELNGYDQHAILSGIFINIFNLSKKHNYTYKNTALLKSVLLEVEPRSDEWKKFITNNLLLYIKSIGNDEVKAIIDNFIEKNILNLACITTQDIMDRLSLIANGYPAPDSFLPVIRTFVSDNIPSNIYNLEFIRNNVESNFPALIEFLINEKGLTEFQEVLDDFNERINSIKTPPVNPNDAT
ncbi:SIR2 family protein [Aeromonas jandaei]|uniref:SIR2 family protein n=1 Tax=Aeromonas jandaei TaxID=650 RepID=UPI00191CC473|nr:SIR2 family protein [Aeromonas jandaei]MBL0597995.1 SIR2 family protein [Aeromonas jandaei]